ncbi:unnamed protein product, partial [marine sediment metagenome]
MIKKCKRCGKLRLIYAKGFCASCAMFNSKYYQDKHPVRGKGKAIKSILFGFFMYA